MASWLLGKCQMRMPSSSPRGALGAKGLGAPEPTYRSSLIQTRIKGMHRFSVPGKPIQRLNLVGITYSVWLVLVPMSDSKK